MLQLPDITRVVQLASTAVAIEMSTMHVLIQEDLSHSIDTTITTTQETIMAALREPVAHLSNNLTSHTGTIERLCHLLLSSNTRLLAFTHLLLRDSLMRTLIDSIDTIDPLLPLLVLSSDRVLQEDLLDR